MAPWKSAPGPFASLDEYFAAARALIVRLECEGHRGAADELSAGFRCLNGLTDGWGLFLAAIETVRSDHEQTLSPDERQRLDELRRVARSMVRRR